MNKKAIAILGAIFILIVGTLGFLIYAKYGGKQAVPPQAAAPVTSGSQQVSSTPPPAQTASSTPPPSMPPAGQAFMKLIDGPLYSPVIFYNGNGVTYFDAQGQLYQATLQNANNQLQVSDKQPVSGVSPKANLAKVLWPQQGDDFLAQLNNGGQTSWTYFNNNTRSYEDLPAQVESIDWLPSGTQVLYIWLENNKATLNIGDPDTKNWKYIADMWEIDDQINISPDGKNILYFEQNSSSSTNPINLTTPDGKVWKSLVKDGYNSGVLWSPDSQKFLFGKKDPSGEVYQLWYYNLLTSEVKSLNASTTPDKAVWGADSQTVYAAVPQKGVAGGSGLTNDQIYKIDTQSNQNKQYDPGSGLAIDARNLFLDNASSKLFFKNAQDGALYYLDLSASAGQ